MRGGTSIIYYPMHSVNNFNPPAPCGAGRLDRSSTWCSSTFQSTRPVRGGTAGSGTYHGAAGISIHPPHAGRDPEMRVCKRCGMISIHPPHAGRDCGPDEPLLSQSKFQSTRPMRGGTVPMSLTLLLWAFQSTRPVRGGTPSAFLALNARGHFNPPAPCGAGLQPVPLDSHFRQFQSTRPVRGGTFV